METTFITIHDLSPEARILYSSDSIVDILGHTPDEVLNRSCWDFFHPEEIPLAKEFHNRGVKLDKAAVLAYCQIKNRYGQWVGCECCFTVVYDVMVVCTSVYRRGMTSQKRAVEAPIVRKLFSSSPKDPRYHMLSHLSTKFNQSSKQQTHEPRAALFLNRFTRTLTIMYATNGIEQIIGISGDEMKGRSFYYCIQENCLEDAVRVLETAKGNDSIAYLRFWFRDPRQDDAAQAQPDTSEDDFTDADESMTDITSPEDEDEGGVQLEGHESTEPATSKERSSDEISPTDSRQRSSTNSMDIDRPSNGEEQSASSGSSSDSTHPAGTHAAIFGHPARARSSTSSAPPTSPNRRSEDGYARIELEAVVSCTSDGLVVCLRKARPLIPPSAQPHAAAQPTYANGLFAAPWAPEPIYLPPLPQLPPQHYGAPPMQAGLGTARPNQPQPPRFPGGPIQQDFMRSIQEVAVFAWALTGINGSLAEYSRGKPVGESLPPDGFPVWVPPDRSAHNRSEDGSSAYGSSHSGRSGNSSTLPEPVASAGCGPSPGGRLPFGDPGLGNGNGNGNGGGGARNNGGLKQFFQW